MKNLLPKDINDHCDYCRNEPLDMKIPNEAIGREVVIIKSDDDLNLIFEKIKEESRELLLIFDLNEYNLNRKYGIELIYFLQKLEKNKNRFILSRPIPRCLLGRNYLKIKNKYSFPIDCYGCRELFSIVDEEIVSCKPINKKGPKIQYMEDRNKIWEYFNTLRLIKKPNSTCKNCLYFKRKQCDGLCYGNIIV